MVGYLFGIAVVALLVALTRELWRGLRPGVRAAKARRDADREADARTEAALATPGATPEAPIEVETASVVEPMAARGRCVVCGEPVRAEDHSVQPIGDEPLRVVTVHCRRCGHRRPVYVRIRDARLH